MWSHKYRFTPESPLHLLLGASNVLVYGPSGAGMSHVVQRALDVAKLIPENQEWGFVECRLSNENKNTLNILSRRTIRCTEYIMRDFGTNERYVVKNLLQKVSESFVISENNQITYKVIVLHNIQHFSKESQHILGVFAEKHSACSRYVFTTHNRSGVYRSLLTQCALFRLPRPSPSALKTFLKDILVRENENIPDNNLDEIIDRQDAHVERCVDHVQMRVLGISSSFEQMMDKIFSIISSKKPNRIKLIRDLVYTLLVNNVNGKEIIMSTLERYANSPYVHQVVHLAALYESRTTACERPMYHLEAFFVNLICLAEYKDV
jgi:DNA polymerase III delta prime subunit